MKKLANKRKVILFSLFVLLILYSQISFAQKEGDNVIDIYLGQFGREHSILKTNHFYEISGNLLHIKDSYSTRSNILFNNSCVRWLKYENNSQRVFDIKVLKNGILIDSNPIVRFIEQPNSTTYVGTLGCYDFGPSDEITLDYYVGNKIIGLTNKSRFDFVFKILKLSINEERYYPFDKYQFNNWRALDENNYTIHTAMIAIPPSFEYLEKSVSFSCPLIEGNDIIKIITNTTSNVTTYEKVFRFALLGYHYTSPTTIASTFFQTSEESGRVLKVSSEVVCNPKTDELKALTMGLNNLTGDFEDRRDRYTGYYAKADYHRPELIKFIFYVSIIGQFLAFVYAILFFYKNLKDMLEKILTIGFTIWTFQEGLNLLSLTNRPRVVTLFDLTILLPILFVALSLLIVILYRIIRKIKFKKIIKNLYKRFIFSRVIMVGGTGNRKNYGSARESALIVVSALAGGFLSYFMGLWMPKPFPINIIMICLYSLFVFFVIYKIWGRFVK